jgi:hypothetical protein
MNRKEMTKKEYKTLGVALVLLLLGSLLSFPLTIMSKVNLLLGLELMLIFSLVSGYFLGALVLLLILKKYLIEKKGGKEHES